MGHTTNEDREVRDNLKEQAGKPLLEALGQPELLWLFGVFDGHGGHAASEHTGSHITGNVMAELLKQSQLEAEEGTAGPSIDVPEALTKGFCTTEEQIVDIEKNSEEDSGTCACCVLLCGRQIYTAHVGDCRAVIASGVTPSGAIASKLTSKELTHDHRGTYPGEKERIAAAGGKMIDGRVNGGLIPSRTLGDLSHKVHCPGAVIAEPDTNQYVLERSDQYLIIASDGLWDDMSNDRVVGIVRKATKAQPAAEALAREAAKKYGGKQMDDFTVIVVRFLHSGA